MNKAIPILILSLAALLTGCGPGKFIIDGTLIVYSVKNNGEGYSKGKYECWVTSLDRPTDFNARFALYTNQRFNVGDRVVITRVAMEDIKVEKKGGK